MEILWYWKSHRASPLNNGHKTHVKSQKKQLKCTVLIDTSKAIVPFCWANLSSKSRSLPRKVWNQKLCLPKCLLYTHSNECTLLKLVIHQSQQQNSTGLTSRECGMTTSITASFFTGHIFCSATFHTHTRHKRSEELNKVQYSLTNFSHCCPLIGQKPWQREKKKEMKRKCREVNQALTLLATLRSHAGCFYQSTST